MVTLGPLTDATQEMTVPGFPAPRPGRRAPRRRWLSIAVLTVLITLATGVPAAAEPTGASTRGRSEATRDDPDLGGTPSSHGAGPAAITVSGDRILRGGQPWWFLGYNSFVWSGDCGHDDEKMTTTQVDAWFDTMRHDGHGAVRLFFYLGWDLDRLDHAIASAAKHDIYLIITLDDAIAGCGENEKTESWFDDAGERADYQEHMTTLLERYRGEATIAWFEYFNEPPYAGGRLRAFYDEMGAVAERIDPDRLFSSGTVAPYWLDGAENFRDVHQSPGVDIASLHEYDADEVESNHGDDVRANSAGKPVIVGEFGIKAGAGCDRSFTDRARQFQAKVDAYITIEGYVGALAWAWQPGSDNTCDLGNLDADDSTQYVLRTTGTTTDGPTGRPFRSDRPR